MMTGRQEENSTETEEAPDEMQSCKFNVQTQTPISQCSIHPTLKKKKSKQYVTCPLEFPVTRCTKIHTVSAYEKKSHKIENFGKKETRKKGLAEFVNIFFKCRFHLLCYASQT